MLPALDDHDFNISSLSGQKIVITAHELESEEHRGISAFTKSLIKVLSECGCEVWLLTEFFPQQPSNKLKDVNSSFTNLTYLFEYLNRGYKKESNLKQKVFSLHPFLNNIYNTYTNIKHHILSIRLKEYPRKKLLTIVNTQRTSPYCKLSRLSYLKNISGFICARRIYYSSLIRSMIGVASPIKIDLEGFDAYISTSPLNIRPVNVNTYIQSIHDLIPLEFNPQSLRSKIFCYQLIESLSSNRMFISNTTKKKFNEAIKYNGIKNKSNYKESIALQLPTLDLDVNVNYSYYLKDYSKNKYGVKSFEYILFNASVDDRKNLPFLIESYIESMIHERNIKLVILGKFNKNTSSDLSIELINNFNSNSKSQYSNPIITTGYIDDEEKTFLYLNSLAMVNPSLIEGLGLPTLDSACLGLPSLISDCDSHKELSNMFDFSNYIIMKDVLSKQNWINALIDVYDQNIDCPPFEESKQFEANQKRIKSRIERYISYKQIIYNNFAKSITSLFDFH